MTMENEKQICPLCGKDKYMGDKAKLLYEKLVCRNCYYSFANRRQIAFLIDLVLWYLIGGFVAGIVIGFLNIPDLSDEQWRGLSFILFPIFCLKDGFKGRSPGKAIMGVQVVSTTTGNPISFFDSFKRNLPLMIPFMQLIVAFQLRKGVRTGDGWAYSRVLWKKFKDRSPFGITDMTKAI